MNNNVNSSAHKYQSLDSLRGIAALMVVFQHFWEMSNPSDARLKPWLFFCAGHEAVILFFVLSGFVLSHQLRNFKFKQYPQFILRRILRIYPAYYVALTFSAILLVYISRYHPATLAQYGLTPWFYIWSRTSFDSSMWIGSLSLISHQGNSLDVATWSLFYEMWLSLVFPLLIFGFVRSNILLRIISFGLIISLSYYFWRYGNLLDNQWQSIVYYSWYFICGMYLYHYHQRLKFSASWLGLLIGCALYFSNYLLFGKIASRMSHETLIACGSCLIMVNCLYFAPLKQLLNITLFRFYGKISYSLYLFHLPIIYALGYLYLPHGSLLVLKILTIILSTLIAWVSYLVIEQNFIKLAKKYVN
ncbi:MAG: acyltransferase [Neisseriaceae bacterium]|nr:MAG: acyltransferase [Neisseriaceae bacterium]